MIEETLYDRYWLKGPYHGNYWNGLTTGKGRSREWYWLDRTVKYDNQTGYQAWGRLSSGSGAAIQEPNNILGNENCGISNWTMRGGTPSVFGWADVPCNLKLPALCKVRRKWLRLLLRY